MEILFYIGLLLSFVGWIWLVVLGFKDHWGWGLGILIFGIVGLVYGFMNFQKAKVPTLMMLVGVILYFVGVGSVVSAAMNAH